MIRKTNKPFAPKEFKGNRRQRRELSRAMNAEYKAYMWEVETTEQEYYYVVALNIDHVKEILQAADVQIPEEDIFWIKPLNQDQMEQVTVDDDKTLYDLYLTYEGNGGVICSTLW